MSVIVHQDSLVRTVIRLWIGAPVIHVRMEPDARKMDHPSSVPVHQAGPARSAMSGRSRVRLPPTTREPRCPACVRMEAHVVTLASPTPVTVSRVTGARTVNMNLTPAPPTRATMEQPAATLCLHTVVSVPRVSWVLNVRLTSMNVLATHVTTEVLALISLDNLNAPVLLELKER